MVAGGFVLLCCAIGGVLGVVFPYSSHPDDQFGDVAIASVALGLPGAVLSYPLALYRMRRIALIEALAAIAFPLTFAWSGYCQLCGDSSSARILMLTAFLLFLFLGIRAARSRLTKRSH